MELMLFAGTMKLTLSGWPGNFGMPERDAYLTLGNNVYLFFMEKAEYLNIVRAFLNQR